MNIGIDIDGVLCNEDLFKLAYGVKYCYEKKIHLSNLSPFLPETRDIFAWSTREDMLFWQENYLQYLTTSAFAYPNSAKAIQTLYDVGHKIFIITQRNQITLDILKIHENMEFLTKTWLKENNIPYHQLIFTENSKESIIQEKKISLMIDDNPQLLMTLSRYMMVIGFRAHCNLQYPLTNIPMVSSWIELMNIIETLKERRKI